VAVAAVFLSSIPEGLPSPVGIKYAGREVEYVVGVWGGIARLSGVAGLIAVVGFLAAFVFEA